MITKSTILGAALAGIVAVPASAATETYTIDPDHTYPSFEFPHMGISWWRGKFDRTKGTITVDRAAQTGTVDIVVDTASVDFGHDEMDKHARSKGWFDVEKYPEATYKGSFKLAGGAPKTVDGIFTFRGVQKPLKLVVNSFKCIEHPMKKKEVCGADASGELNWGEFGMEKSKYAAGDAGRTVLRIQVEALKQ